MKQVLRCIFPEIIQIRHQIHSYPELAHDEKHTAALVADTLRKYGYNVKEEIAGTGVSTVLDSGKPGKTVGLRADMDALPRLI
jgi:metal-dependent amidase/aminoacylase/carboxypeptidase family protein